MNIEQLQYFNYLLPLPCGMVVSSYTNIDNVTPISPEEITYSTYRQTLSPIDQVESDYIVFDAMKEAIDPSMYGAYEMVFVDAGYFNFMDVGCKRRKEPQK